MELKTYQDVLSLRILGGIEMIQLKLLCKKCDLILSVTKTNLDEISDITTFYVTPCPECLKEERGIGFDNGYSDAENEYQG